MPVPISAETHGRGRPVTVICRVASAVAEVLSVARTTNELSPAVPEGGVPDSAPLDATASQAGPLTFE